MRQFKVKKGNYIKSPDSTKNMMNYLVISLLPIIIFAFYKNGILPLIRGKGNIMEFFKPLVFVLIPAFVCLLIEYIYYVIKKDKKDIKFLINESFALIPGIFIGLIIPINTPIWLIIIAAIIASISKMLFGGLGKNPLNPALVGALFIIIFASSYIGTQGGYLNSYEVDAISGATPLANFSALSYAGTYEEIVSPYGSLWSFFFGSIPGAVGETSALLCIFAFVFLLANNVIKWRIPVFYVLTVFITSLLIGLNNNMGLWYPIFCILSGSLLFGAVFMVTDPVTSPITKHGQIIGGIILGLLTIGIRYLTSYPEGVLISILIFNILTMFINKLSIKYNSNKIYKILSFSLVIIVGTILTIVISNKVDYNPKTNTDPNFQVTNSEKEGSRTIYYVTSRGFSGKKSIKSKITMENNNIIKLEILSNKESYYNLIEETDYLNKIVDNQNKLNEVEAISGATYTSDYLKEIIIKIKEYDKR